MKQLTCELCGSTNFVKQDGMFVCQDCGTKYTVEEARKMMGAEGPAPAAKDTRMIENFLSMAKNALDAGNNAEAESYSNKIIEVDPTNYEAWFIKGKAVGWQSTLGNQRIGETINAFSLALDNCPEEKHDELAQECKTEIEKLHKALLMVRMKNFMNNPNDNDIQGLTNDVTNILTNTGNFLIKAGVLANAFGKEFGTIISNAVINNYNEKIHKKYLGDDNRPGDYAFKRFISETDICIKALDLAATLLGDDDTDDLELYEWRALTYRAMATYDELARDACSWSYNFTSYGKSYYKNLTLTSSAIALRNQQIKEYKEKQAKWEGKKKAKEQAIKEEKERVAREEARKRFEEYWAEHAEEKAALEAEQAELPEKIAALNASRDEQVKALRKELAEIPGKAEIEALDARIAKLTEEKAGLGIFKGKEKKALQEQIDQLGEEKQSIESRMAAKKKELEGKINLTIADFKRKISPLQSRLNEISDELSKDR